MHCRREKEKTAHDSIIIKRREWNITGISKNNSIPDLRPPRLFTDKPKQIPNKHQGVWFKVKHRRNHEHIKNESRK